jgi:glucokinase-like ROK family protein
MGSLEALRELNRLRIVAALRRHGTASRSELARLTGLSRTTVATLVGDLRARGLVVEVPDADREAEPAGKGRPPILLRLDASAGAALGVDFNHDHIRVAVADLSSTVLAERKADLDVDQAGTLALDVAVELVDSVLDDAGVTPDQVVGVGMGVPGPIDRRTGMLGTSPIMPGWAGLEIRERLGGMLGLPVEVDNDANLGALGEVTFGAGRGYSELVYVKLSSGIGAGLVLDGQLHRGATGIAGELGHVQVRAEGAVCRCGYRGCLETIASSGALVELLRPAHGAELTVSGLLDLVDRGDIGATRVVSDASRVVGRVLANVCNHLNPEVVVVGGELSAAGAPLLNGIRETIDRYAQPGNASAVEVRAGVLGDRAVMLGALALVIGNTDLLSSSGLAALHHDPAPEPAGTRSR